MNDLLNNLIYPAILAVLAAFLGYAISLLKDNKKTGDANAKGTMLLLRREIIDAHKRYCQRGEPMDAFGYKDVQEIHTAYKALGGNGLTDKMFAELEALEIKGE